MRGNPPKHPDRAQGHRRRRGFLLLPPSPVVEVRDTPPAPEGLDDATLAWWRDVWASPVARAWDAVKDGQAIARLARLYVEERELQTLAAGSPVVRGSTGSPVVHPALRAVKTTRRLILDLESACGLSPRAGLSLGLQMGAARRNLTDLSREASERARRRRPTTARKPRR